MTEIQPRLELCDPDECACIDNDSDDTASCSTDSMSAIHKLSTGMGSMTTVESDAAHDIPTSADDYRLHRIPTLAASVKINVEGAFIVDDDSDKEEAPIPEHVHWERKDIRLPHHTDVVSHVAVDVRTLSRAEPSID